MSHAAIEETPEARVARLVSEYADGAPAAGALPSGLSLKDELGIESMSLVSLVARLGEELNVDLGSVDLELGSVKTVGDLVKVAHTLARSPRA